MNIYAKGKAYVQNNLEALLDHENVAIISITGTGDPTVINSDTIPATAEERTISFVFDDLRPSTAGTATAWDSEILTNIRNSQPMTYAQALELHEFINGLPKEIDSIIVHCSAGISRSGAVARFLSETMSGVQEERFVKDNPQIMPNVWVYDLLWSTHWERQNGRND